MSQVTPAPAGTSKPRWIRLVAATIMVVLMAALVALATHHSRRSGFDAGFAAGLASAQAASETAALADPYDPLRPTEELEVSGYVGGVMHACATEQELTLAHSGYSSMLDLTFSAYVVEKDDRDPEDTLRLTWRGAAVKALVVDALYSTSSGGRTNRSFVVPVVDNQVDPELREFPPAHMKHKAVLTLADKLPGWDGDTTTLSVRSTVCLQPDSQG